MRQEHKLCADVYHHLFDHIDHERPVFFCLDGAAAEEARNRGQLLHARVPDLRFFFRGAHEPMTIEAKIVASQKVRFCGDGEPTAWHSTGAGKYKPLLWIGASEDFQTYYLWEHDLFATTLSALVGKGKTKGGRSKTLEARIPDASNRFKNAASLTKGILEWALAARERGLFPLPPAGLVSTSR